MNGDELRQEERAAVAAAGPEGEARRAALERYGLLDRTRRPDFSDIMRLAAASCDTQMAAINVIAPDRPWTVAEIGLGPGRTEPPLCAPCFTGGELTVFADLGEEEAFRDDPLVAGPPHLRFYAAAPLIASGGTIIGALCVYDPAQRPGGLSDSQAFALEALARQIMVQLELNATAAESACREAEARERESELRQARTGAETLAAERNAVLGQLAEGVVVTDASGKIVFVNEAAATIHGVSRLDVAPADYSRTYHLFTEDGTPYPPDELPLTRAVKRGETIREARWRIRRPDGANVLAVGSAGPVRDSGGRQVGAVLTLRDDTARENALHASHESEARLRALADNLPVGMIYQMQMKPDGSERRFVYVSQSCEALTGVPADSLMAEPSAAYDLIDEDHLPLLHEAEKQALAARSSLDLEVAFRKSGERRWCRIISAPREMADGSLVWDGLQIDTTDQRRAADAFRESETKFRAITDTMPQLVWSTLPDGYHDYYNRAWYYYTGEDYETTKGPGWNTIVHPDDQERAFARWRHSLETGEDYEIEYRFRRADGAYRWFLGRALPLRDEAGRITRWFGTCTDIEEMVQARDVLARHREELEREVEERTLERNRIFQLSDDLFAIADFEGRLHTVNPAWTRLLGHSETTLLSHPFSELVHPDDLASLTAVVGALSEGHAVRRFEDRLRHADGTYRWIAWTAVPEGDFLYAVGRDVTEENDAAAELEEAYRRVQEEMASRERSDAARREAEAQLRQVQKMESIGQLTGGVAHDFNNLLTIIIGNLETLQRHADGGDSARLARAADNAMRGAQRAATLTSRLLAFSRRQPLDPKPVNVNRLVAGMSDLLGRTLGEQVAIETVLAGGLWPTLADPNQLENAIINLAVNARDAMPDGGRLTIETANSRLDETYAARHPDVAEGQYVLVSISDTGMGMDREVLAQAFEPFFTTKDVGHGTGLGLSQVYGFVKQSGGHVAIYSEPDQGSTVKIYLPRLYDMAAAEQADREPAPVPAGGGTETVLVVEDEDDVRAHSTEILRELGYRVLEAGDGVSALQILDHEPGIRLLFTDVGLPGGMNGRQLADEARRRRPALKVLFATAYARNAIVHGGRLDPGVQLVTKPFTYADLAAKVRDILDAHDAAPRILVVEDEMLVRMVAVDSLEELGYRVEEAASAGEAMAKFAAAGGRLDAAVIDIGLPDRKGDALAAEMRAQLGDLPIVIASGYAESEVKARFEGDPRVVFLGKPYDRDRLLSALRDLGVPVPNA